MKKLKLILTVGMIACLQWSFNSNAQNIQTNYARVFKIKNSVIYADGKPFPLIMDFTWSTEPSEEFFHYWSRMGGTCHYQLDTAINFTKMDKEIDLSAKFGIYSVVAPNIAMFGGRWGYAKTYPSAEMKGPGGSRVHRAYPSFTHEGYRTALVKALRELALHCKNKPYFLGYYLQDEFAYPGWGGYEAASVNVFRDRMILQYGTLDKLNTAWGTKYVSKEEITPPKPQEQTGRRWADWQLFRSWAYTDLLRVCYQAIKEVDPNHLVINSMSFWPTCCTASSWWSIPPHTDILMRHGIGYRLGYNFLVLRDIAQWSGKAGAALCMPPGHSLSFTQFMRFLDSSRVGLSHVCVAGGKIYAHYCGPADSDDCFRRREPQYTPAKSIIQLQHYLGDTYLNSKCRPPQVGYLIGDNKVTIGGGSSRGIAGMLEILTDLDVDFEIVSEHNYAPLKRFQAIIIGPESGLVSEEMVIAVNKYVQNGGAAILMPGAFKKNEWNETCSTNLFPPSSRFGKPVSCKSVIADGIKIPVLKAKKVCPVNVKSGDKILARMAKGQTNEVSAAISGDGKILFLGWDVGIPYQQNWAYDFANVGKNDASDAGLLENAFGDDAGDLLKVETAVGLQPQRRIAAWIKAFLTAQQVAPYVVVKGYETPALVHAKSFAAGSDIWMGIANRVVKPGQNLVGWEWDMEKYPECGGAWPADFHVPITNAEIRVKLPENFSDGARCFLMPNMKVDGERLVAVPEELPVEIVKTGDEKKGKEARFTIGRIDDWATVVLSSGYKPLAGLELERREIVQGTTNVNVRMTLLNATDKIIKGELILKDEDGLCNELPAPVSYELKRGETKMLKLELAVALDVKTGYYNLKAEALDSNGTVAESMGLEIRVLEPVVIAMKPHYLYVKPDMPAKVELKAVFRDDATRCPISVEIEGFTNFVFEKNNEKWTPDGAKEHTFVFTVKPPQVDNIREAGKIIIRGNFKDLERELCITAGTVAYRENGRGRITNSSREVSDTEFACLENERLIARFAITSGVLHNLIVRQTGMELLSPDKYPFGLTWYNRRGGWKLKKMGSGQITLSLGKISMTATLKSGGEFLDVNYDTTGVELTKKDSFYLMSRIGTKGFKQNVMHVPLKNGVRDLKWKSGKKEYKPDEMAGQWLAVEDKASGHILATFFDVPNLKKVSLAPGKSKFNYEIFYLKEGAFTGRIHFRLFGVRGGVEEITEWEKLWQNREK